MIALARAPESVSEDCLVINIYTLFYMLASKAINDKNVALWKMDMAATSCLSNQGRTCGSGAAVGSSRGLAAGNLVPVSRCEGFIKPDFHSVQNVARSTFSDRYFR